MHPLLLKSRLARLLPCITQKPLKWLRTQIPATVPAACRQRAHAARLEQRDLHTLRPPSSSFSSPVHLLLQDPSWRRSVNFLPPARGIFCSQIRKYSIFCSSPYIKQTLRELGRHSEYFLCEQSVPGHFLPQGTVYLMWGRLLQQESKAFVLLPDEQKNSRFSTTAMPEKFLFEIWLQLLRAMSHQGSHCTPKSPTSALTAVCSERTNPETTHK